MNKSLLFLTISLFSTQLAAQFSMDSNFKIGLHLASEKVEVNGIGITTDNRPSILAGASVEMHFDDIWGMQVEVFYQQNGSILKTNGYKYENEMHYVESALMLQYHLTDRLSVLAGPQFGYLFKAREEDNDPNTFNSFGDTTDAYTDWNLSAAGGAEYSFSDRLDLGARYVQGLTNVLKENQVPGATITNTLRGIQFYLEIKIDSF